MSEAHHPIQLAARLTGLSTHVIRIWEQRYHAVEPQRTPTNHCRYSQDDIERLSLLRDVTRAGHNISQMARLSNDKLRALAAQASGREASGSASGRARGRCLGGRVSGVCAIPQRAQLGRYAPARHDRAGHARSAPAAGRSAGANREHWREGTITAAHEHFATGHLRAFLGSLARPFGGSEGAPALVVAMLAGQLHELGALLAGALAANLGWQVTNLGFSLPAAEIAGAARQKRARAVALSLVYPEDDAGPPGELARLRESLPGEVALLVGGRAMPADRETLVRLGAILAKDLPQPGQALDRLRRTARQA